MTFLVNYFKSLGLVGFSRASCSSGTTRSDDRSARTASKLWRLSTNIKLSFLKLMIDAASNGNTSMESYARMRSHKNSSCSGIRCPENALMIQRKTREPMLQNFFCWNWPYRLWGAVYHFGPSGTNAKLLGTNCKIATSSSAVSHTTKTRHHQL